MINTALKHKSQQKNYFTRKISENPQSYYSIIPENIFTLSDLSISERSVLLFLHLVEMKGFIALKTLKDRYLGFKSTSSHAMPRQLRSILIKLEELNYIRRHFNEEKLSSLEILNDNFKFTRCIKVSKSLPYDQRTSLKELFHLVFISAFPNYSEKSIAIKLGESRNTVHKLLSTLVNLGLAKELYSWHKSKNGLKVKNCYRFYEGTKSPLVNKSWSDIFERKCKELPAERLFKPVHNSDFTVAIIEHTLIRLKYIKNNKQIQAFDMRSNKTLSDCWIEVLGDSENEMFLRHVHFLRKTTQKFTGDYEATKETVEEYIHNPENLKQSVMFSDQNGFAKYIAKAIQAVNTNKFRLIDVLKERTPFLDIIMKRVEIAHGERFCKAFIRWTIKALITEEKSFPNVFTLTDYLMVRLENTYYNYTETSQWDEDYIFEEENAKPIRAAEIIVPAEHRMLGMKDERTFAPSTGLFDMSSLVERIKNKVQ